MKSQNVRIYRTGIILRNRNRRIVIAPMKGEVSGSCINITTMHQEKLPDNTTLAITKIIKNRVSVLAFALSDDGLQELYDALGAEMQRRQMLAEEIDSTKTNELT